MKQEMVKNLIAQPNTAQGIRDIKRSQPQFQEHQKKFHTGKNDPYFNPKSRQEIRHDMQYLNSAYNNELPQPEKSKEQFYENKIKELQLILEKEQRINKKLSNKKSKFKHKKGSSEKILQSCINIVKKDITRRKSLLGRYLL